MKFAIVLISALICASSAQTTTPSSQIYSDIDTFWNNIWGNIVSQGEPFFTSVKAEVVLVVDTFGNLKNAYNQLAQYLPKNIQKSVNNTFQSIQKFIDNLQNNYNDVSLQDVGNRIREEISEHVDGSLKSLVQAVDKNASLIVCWDLNKQNLANLVNATLQKLVSVVKSEVTAMKPAIDSTCAKVNAAIADVQTSLKKCNGDTTCIQKLVKFSIETLRFNLTNFSCINLGQQSNSSRTAAG